MKLFDSHAHYDDEKFIDDRNEIIMRIKEEGVDRFISAGYSLESSINNLKLSKKYEFIYTISGISPNDIPETEEKIDEQIKQIKEIAKNEKVVAIGEIGLDYYWNQENKELQKYAFIEQIKIANDLNRPIVIHTREAIMDTLDILKNIQPAIKKGVFHCCPLNRELVKEALKLGYYISFAGPVTFKNSKNAEEIIQMVPLEKILIETDSPYLSPEPNRGKRNDSRNLKFIAEKIAKSKDMSIEEIAIATYENAKKIFEIE